MTTHSPTSWPAGTSDARSMWRPCCASAGPRAGRVCRPPAPRRSRTEAVASVAADTWRPVFDPKTGLFEQFAGYFGLEEIDLADYEGRSVPMDVVLGRERTQRSQVIKQADVVRSSALLPEEFSGETERRTSDYYEPRCGHGSSLSRAMHGVVAARLGRSEMALRYFRGPRRSISRDTHAAIDGGVHIAALGGSWMMAVLGFAGCRCKRRRRARSKLPAALAQPSIPPFNGAAGSVKIKIDQDTRRSRSNA